MAVLAVIHTYLGLLEIHTHTIHILEMHGPYLQLPRRHHYEPPVEPFHARTWCTHAHLTGVSGIIIRSRCDERGLVLVVILVYVYNKFTLGNMFYYPPNANGYSYRQLPAAVLLLTASLPRVNSNLRAVCCV